MPTLLVIRLHPVDPITGDTFTGYLTGLSIAAHELSITDPEGNGPAFGTAAYIAPKLPPSPSKTPAPVPDPNGRITQHFEIDPVAGTKNFTRNSFAVATAVIQIPDPPTPGEYRSADVRLVVTRGGSEIVNNQVYYNVSAAPAPLPADPNQFPALQPVSLYLPLPAPGQQSSRAAAAPVDGPAPKFADLRTAIESVLTAEKGNTATIADLTRDECSHVASEITWDPTRFPLPAPPRPLEQIYTGPQTAGSDVERDRLKFEGDLQTYYVQHDSDASRLADAVFSVSAAIWCEQESKKTTQAGFDFPVVLTSSAAEAKVILTGEVSTLAPLFGVPAAYFYALTAVLPPQISRTDRYSMATTDAESHIVSQIEHALTDNLIVEPEGINRYQVARRLVALGAVQETGTPRVTLAPASRIRVLVSDWAAFTGQDITRFWAALSAADTGAHLDLTLAVVTGGNSLLTSAIAAPEFGVKDVKALAGKTTLDWETLLESRPALLPDFTKPGTAVERAQTFIRSLRRFFEVPIVFPVPPSPGPRSISQIDHSPGNPLDNLLTHYPGFSFGNWDAALLASALSAIFPGDPKAQQQFTDWLTCIRGLVTLTGGITPPAVQFSVMEALWARGATNANSIKALSLDALKEALTGSVAYSRAELIWHNAGGVAPGATAGQAGFQPVNPDGSLIDCIPPAYLSPLGPVAYLHELLRLSGESTCDNPFPADARDTLAQLLATRRGPLGNLLASKANLEVPLPLIDIVDESLEHMAATATAVGAVYNTPSDQIGGHQLSSNASPPRDSYLHNPETLLEALPQDSTPATPTAQQTAYDKLEVDFSCCSLPYSQPLDISRTYLEQLGTSRFSTMRRFRKDITEFVLDPSKQTADFQANLWRYPVRIDTAIEYLGITPEEYTVLFQNNLSPLAVSGLYGFSTGAAGGSDAQNWAQVVLQLDEFLKRACLTYCELVELWKSQFVRFQLIEKGKPLEAFPECEPCCLNEYLIRFTEPSDQVVALTRLAVFIRLWRKLQAVPNAGYTFTQLRDICQVLALFNGGNINPDFIRQLIAFEILRHEFHLSLTEDGPIVAGATGADRLHLLSLWAPGAIKWGWAVEHLLNQIHEYAVKTHGCGRREPEFIKLLASNLDPLSGLAGFDPNNAPDTWHAHPAHTLRFVEVLAKIYASEFRVGELLFLFTNTEHLEGDDPFPLQTTNEAKDTPLGLPDDESEYSLWKLRKKLLAVEVNGEAAEHWTWRRMEAALREEFGYAPLPGGNDAWTSLGQHFFPAELAHSGIAVSHLHRQYRVPLALPTSESMWNTPPDGPFHYDAAAQQLWTRIPLSDEAVLAKLSRVRQLTGPEMDAVRDLYFLPRVDLARFAFIFGNFSAAAEHLIQEREEERRWHWFQREFALFHHRSRVIAEHLAGHVAEVTGHSDRDGAEVARLLLKHLWAAENLAMAPWENDNGQAPQVTWQPQPNGGAFAALLGLMGTGMAAEYFDAAETLRWREVRGGAHLFGHEENAWNAPVPTIIPSPVFTFPPQQRRFATTRNGFAMADTNSAMLGGAEPFTVHWKGLLLIEKDGQYGFSGGAPTPGCELPDFERICDSHRWRVILKQGQRTWVLLAHGWREEEAPGHCSKPIRLRRGFYELSIRLERKAPLFDDTEELRRQTTGFELKYNGPDAGEEWSAVAYDKLFQSKKDATLQSGIKLTGAAQDFLGVHYTSSLRDIRLTYQRGFKIALFSSRLHLEARRLADDGQSELGYMLAHPVNFAGQAYYRRAGAFITHKANFDPNFLPASDNYEPGAAAQDQRLAPTAQREQAMFDWWERMFDYTVMRREARRSPERPAWLLFHESAESHQDNPGHLLRYLGVDLRHDPAVLRFFDPTQTSLAYDITGNDLEDERWTLRVWNADKWVRALERRFYVRDITAAQVFLWASDGPSIAGNANLTQFYGDGCIENGEPRRYEEIKRLNDGLRLRGRAALVNFLTRVNRVPLPWGGFATDGKDLSELLLVDVETGLCRKASRIEEAISAVQEFVQRARLGLEPGLVPSREFVLVFDRRFAGFRGWEACKRRAIYQENWIEWDELRAAKRTEGFRFLESELRRAALTIPVPGGLADWSGPRPPAHPGVTLLQHREPATMQLLNPAPEGLELMGTPDRHARPTWLAPLNGASSAPPTLPGSKELPLWLQAAVRLGANFVRVAAAGTPPATTTFEPKCGLAATPACCAACGDVHPPLMDEYYFWIEDTRYYSEQTQVAEWGASSSDPTSDWHRPNKLPGLLDWDSKRMVHLRWSRLHHCELEDPRQSYEGVRITAGATPQLVFSGRTGDSLYFEVTGGEAPIGFAPAPPPPGFRYDLATDEAITLPEVVVSPAPPLVGGLVAFPFFAWFNPGAPLLPHSPFSEAITVAGHLRSHCRYEAALKWYEVVYNPLRNDNTWMICRRKNPNTFFRNANGLLPAEECCCASDPVTDAQARERAMLLHYLDTLEQWGDALMRKNTPEAFEKARLIFDTAAKILGPTPITVLSKDEGPQTTTTVAEFTPGCAPINPRLMCLYTNVNDRLALIRSCLNARRLKNGRANLDMPYFGNSETRDCCWKTTSDVCADEGDWCAPQSPYRFVFLIQKANEFAGDVRALGGALLAAYEKGDAEYLGTMRAMQERQMLNLALEVRQQQWREAQWQGQALQKTKEIAQTNLQYYNNLIAVGLIAKEAQYEPLTIASTVFRAAGNVSEALSQVLNLVPDPNVGTVTFLTMPPGKKVAAIASAAGHISLTIADILNTIASLGLTKAGWERRLQEWNNRVDNLTLEIEQIERQILAADRRQDIALRELNNHQQQIDNAAEVHDFLRDKFTNHDLYLWMQQETAALHCRMYEMAFHCARQAEHAFNFERGYTARRFIPAEIWDNLHEGLLAGERLQVALRHMERAYYDENVREYELTKHISLRLHFPLAFLQLRVTGYCEIDLPEWMFDLDYPGHYMRRVRNVTMTIPCVVGPYTGVHCRLTLLSSKTRVDPRLVNPPHACCHDERWKNGYQAMPDDCRIVSMYAATEAIATSSGQNDSGMFELNFRDERYLPFEDAGAVSRWRIELPQDNNQFDVETITDVVLHMNFTAREGGENLRKAANECAQHNLPGEGVRFFDVKREFPEAWQLFVGEKHHHPVCKQLGVRLSRSMFPFLTGDRRIGVRRLEILFEAPCADPSAHHMVEFLVGQRSSHRKEEECELEPRSVECVAHANWPGLFHGVLDVDFEALRSSGHQDLGVFRFPAEVGEVTDAYLFCGYKMLPQGDTCLTHTRGERSGVAEPRSDRRSEYETIGR